MQVVAGFAPDQRDDAARLYWQAFGGKLGRIFGPEPRGLAYLARVLSPAHCLAISDRDGRLIALAGFKSPQGGLAQGKAGDLRAVYGRFGALWRGLVLRMLHSDIDNRRFLIDGICVAPDHRGKGLGRALLHALGDVARSRGYREMRLEVLPDNMAARRLYDANGFHLMRRERRGPLQWATGIGAALVLVRQL